MQNGSETYHGGEQGHEASSEAAGERAAELLKNHEAASEQSPEQTAEQLESRRNEVREVFAADAHTEQKAPSEPNGFRAIRRVTSAEKRQAYRETMKRIRGEMSAPARAFSKIIHNTSVERASAVLGSTLARPNAVLGGSIAALVAVSALYVIAKMFGYPLSGFETISAFVIGWLIGLGYDYVRTLANGKSD